MANYEITFEIDGEGNTDPSPGTYNYNEGEEVPIQAFPAEHFEFKRWRSEAFDLRLDEFADERGTSNFYWRGYVFKVTEEAVLSDIYGGATAEGHFLWGFYEVEYDENEGYYSLDVIKLVKNSQGDDLWGDLPGERHYSCQQYADENSDARDIDINAVLDPDKYYVFAQGRKSGYSGTHHYELDPDTFDYDSFVEEHDILEFFGPDEVPENSDQHQYSFRWWTGDQYTPIEMDLNPGTSTFPDMSIEVESSGVTIEDRDSPDTQMTVDGDDIVTAQFKRKKLDLFVEAISHTGGGGYLNIEGTTVSDGNQDTVKVDSGEDIDLIANPDGNSYFNHWGGDIFSYDNPHTIEEISENKSISGTFSTEDITLTINYEGAGGGLESHTPGETYVYTADEEVEIQASIPDSGWEFTGWVEGISNDVIDDPNSLTTYVTMTREINLTAVYTIIQHELTINYQGEGSVSPYEGTELHEEGSTVELDASPDLGWEFVEWTGDISSTSPNTNITVTDEMEVTAIFVESEYELHTMIEGEGEIELNPDQPYYNYGDIVNLEAIPDAGWEFEEWIGNVDDTESSETTITMYSGEVVTARFEVKTYEVIVNYDSSQGSVSGIGNYPEGETVELEAIPDENHNFVEWTGYIESNDKIISFEMPDHDVNLNCTFEGKEYDLILEVIGSGEIEVTPDEEIYRYGDEVQVEAIPDEGWGFSEWGYHLSGDNEVETITIEGTTSILATFLEVYTLDIEIIGEGTVSKNPDKADYLDGEEVDLTANPASFWEFSHWSGNISDVTDPNTIVTMNQDQEVLAVFGDELFEVLYHQPDEGTLEARVDGSYIESGSMIARGRDIEFTIIANIDHIITGLCINDNLIVDLNLEQGIYPVVAPVDPSVIVYDDKRNPLMERVYLTSQHRVSTGHYEYFYKVPNGNTPIVVEFKGIVNGKEVVARRKIERVWSDKIDLHDCKPDMP